MKLLSWLAVSQACTLALANTEKVIFLAPSISDLPDSKPGTEFLTVPALTHQAPTLRVSLPVRFTSEEQPTGTDHWYLLRGLNAGQRYELRVCWAATQPTRFDLSVHTIADVFDSPQLLNNLASTIRRPDPRAPHAAKSDGDSRLAGTRDSVLFLHIEASADYFSPNKTLMLDPPPVDVDIILDPYTASVFPSSLHATAVYLVVLAAAGYLCSKLRPARQASITTSRQSFYSLPVELILDIVDMLSPEDFINFAFASYPSLQDIHIAPALSDSRIRYLTANTRILTWFQLLRVPAEITLQIMRHLGPSDVMNFVLANYQELARQGIAPPLGVETIQNLRKAVR